jgi:hemolysin III
MAQQKAGGQTTARRHRQQPDPATVLPGRAATENPAARARPAQVPVAPRPRLRGWIHAITAPVSLAAGIILGIRAPTVPAAVAVAVYTATAVTLFGISAAYHLGAWPPKVRVILRRIDHADILLLIAGTYTPIAALALHGASRVAILTVVWAGAALGFLFQAGWTGLPRWIYVPVYLGLGWAAVFVLPQLLNGAGLTALLLIVAGGVLYTLGGTAYGLRRPDPWPRWFGFHEIFHACTVAAFACQYAAIWAVVCHAA